MFHKECIFEWLVNGHNECPCCRTDMVTKSEIKETSASLIGSERLAQAMAVVNGSVMVEAPPFQARRPRLPGHVLARAQSPRSSWNSRRHSVDPLLPSQTPNAHWLWTARFGDMQSEPSSITGNSGVSSMAPLNEGAPQTFSQDERLYVTSLPEVASPTSPSRPMSNNGVHSHNQDWLWTARFENTENQGSNPPTTPINLNALSSPSSPVTVNPHQANRSPTTTSNESATNGHEVSVHPSRPGTMLPSTTIHSRRTQRQIGANPNPASLTASSQCAAVTLSPTSSRHAYWQSTTRSESSVRHQQPNSTLRSETVLSNAANEAAVIRTRSGLQTISTFPNNTTSECAGM